MAFSTSAEEIEVVKDGKYYAPMIGYRVGDRYYLSAKEVSGAYGGQFYWYPVAGRVQMSFRGKLLRFLASSNVAVAGTKKIQMRDRVMLRSSEVLIPLSFFESEDFSSWIGMDTTFNARTRLLTVDRRASVGAVRWFSYKDSTRVLVELDRGLTYNLTPRGLRGLQLSIPLGVIEASDEVATLDERVDGYILRQDLKAARLELRLKAAGSHWRIKELARPRRLAIDVYAKAPGAQAPGGAAVRAGGSEPVADVSTTPKAGVLPVITASGKPKRRVVIDAGHGGKDSGALGRRKTYEKDINLVAAQELAELLRQEDAFDVLLTRTDDNFVPLGDRSRMANEYDTDLFISLHCNAARNRRESGYEIYFLSEKASDPEAERLAEFENSVVELEGKEAVEEEAQALLVQMAKTEHINAASELAGLMARALSRRVDLPNRGVKQADFYVLRGTNAPAVLFEMAFVSNAKDEAKLESRKYRRKIIDGVYEGLLEYAKGRGWIAQAP